MSYTPAAGGDSAPTSDSGSGGLGGQQSFNAYTSVGVGSYFPVTYDYTGAHPAVSPVPRAAAMDPDLRGEFNAYSGAQALNVQMLQALYRMPPDNLGEIQTLLTAAGYGRVTSSGFVDEDTLGGYNKLLMDTAAYQANNPDTQMTPLQLLNLRAQYAIKHGGGRGGYGSSGGQPSTETHSNITYANPEAARQLAHDTFSNNLGRAPSKKERDAFTAALHAYERSHPQISTTTGIGSGHTTTTTQGGADEGAFASAYSTSTQALANEVGSQHEIGFVNVLSRMMGA